MDAAGFARQGAKASKTMIFSSLIRHNSVPARQELT